MQTCDQTKNAADAVWFFLFQVIGTVLFVPNAPITPTATGNALTANVVEILKTWAVAALLTRSVAASHVFVSSLSKRRKQRWSNES